MSISDVIQLVLVSITFFAVLVALFGERFWGWWGRPELVVDFDSSSERCLRKNITQINQNSQSNEVRHFFRLRVTNNGRTGAKKLRAKVELFNPDKTLADNFEPSTLHWITGREYIDLARGENWYVDLFSQRVSIDEGHPLRVEIFDKSPRGILWDRPLSPCVAQVVIHGENISKPVMKYYKFSPNGKGIGCLDEINLKARRVTSKKVK